MQRLAILLIAITASAQNTFTNPLLPNGADPWIERDGSNYYLTVTTGKNLIIRKSATLAGLKTAERTIVWTPPATGPNSKQLWAPELHHIGNKWYLYFSADDGDNHNHRLFVLENVDADPTTQHWSFKGKLTTSDDQWAIDATVFEYRNRWYAAWAGWPADKNGVQNIYLARMKNPWTLEGNRVLLSAPQYVWEKFGDLDKPDGKTTHLDVNEGPEVLQHNGHLFLTYSASACWTDHYALGMLTLASNGDPLDPHVWTKSSEPVFSTDGDAHAFGPGHNGFFTSPDGKESWIVFHSNPAPHQGCGTHRATRVQRFTWNADGSPNFGKPLPLDTLIPAPSGEGNTQR